MDRLEEAASVLTRGSFHTFLGNTLALVLGAGHTILVAGLLSPSEYGQYIVALVPTGLFALFTSWGISVALTRFIAQHRTSGEEERIRHIIRVGFLFIMVIGGLLTTIVFFLSENLAGVLLNRPALGTFIRVTSLGLLFQPLYTVALSVLAGFEQMDRRALVYIAPYVVKLLLSPLLVYFGFGVLGAIIGRVVGFLGGALLGIAFAWMLAPVPVHTLPMEVKYWDDLRMMLQFGLPVFGGTLITGIINQIRRVLLPWFVSDELIGNFDIASKFSMLVTGFTGAFGVTLYPMFSKFRHAVEPEQTRKVFRAAVRYSGMIVLPVTLLLVALSMPMISTLFDVKYPEAPQLLVLLLLQFLLVSTGSLSIPPFLNSQDATRTTLRFQLVYSLTSMLLTPFLLMIWGVHGFIFSSLFSSLLANIYGLYVLHYTYEITLNYRHASQMLLCVLTSSIVTYGVVQVISWPPSFLILLIGVGVFLGIYLVLAPIVGAIRRSDVHIIRRLVSGLPLIGVVLRILLAVETKILQRISMLKF